MTMREIATAMQRVEAILQRRPEFGMHDDAPASASWEGGTRAVSTHANGTRIVTDMPAELGGSGDQVTPGWLLRAGLAACAVTRIAMAAAVENIELTALQAVASSRSDTRGMIGMSDADGNPVQAAPCEAHLHVRISARGVSPERLRALVEDSQCCSPVSSALQVEVPLTLFVEVDAA
ncbi:MAG: OsmC family protein [Burkholderiales bacterium]|nr:OsmC family protein [Burkholderiales bacterium]